jgi:hypothetical protein
MDSSLRVLAQQAVGLFAFPEGFQFIKGAQGQIKIFRHGYFSFQKMRAIIRPLDC